MTLYEQGHAGLTKIFANARSPWFLVLYVGDRFLSSAGAGGNCARPMRLPDPSPVLDKNRAPMSPEILSGTGWLGSGEKLLCHFQTPVLYWINFSLRLWA